MISCGKALDSGKYTKVADCATVGYQANILIVFVSDIVYVSVAICIK